MQRIVRMILDNKNIPFEGERERMYTAVIKNRQLVEGSCGLRWSDYAAYRDKQGGKPLTAADLAYVGQYTGQAIPALADQAKRPKAARRAKPEPKRPAAKARTKKPSGKFTTDRQLKAFKASPDGKAYDVRDGQIKGLRVRVMPNTKTFVLMARFPGNRQPTRQSLGTFGDGAMMLKEARRKAADWKEKLKANIDPRDEEERQRLAEHRKRQNSFAAVAEEFIKYIHRQKLRTAPVMEHNLNRTFVAAAKWGPRPITEITSGDVRRVLEAAVDRGSPYQAFHDLALVRRLFNWAVGTDQYGLERNPCDRLKSRRHHRRTSRARSRAQR